MLRKTSDANWWIERQLPKYSVSSATKSRCPSACSASRVIVRVWFSPRAPVSAVIVPFGALRVSPRLRVVGQGGSPILRVSRRYVAVWFSRVLRGLRVIIRLHIWFSSGVLRGPRVSSSAACETRLTSSSKSPDAHVPDVRESSGDFRVTRVKLGHEHPTGATSGFLGEPIPSRLNVGVQPTGNSDVQEES
jgi:hypothetical protein